MSSVIQLNGPQVGQLSDVLRAAFTPNDFDLMVWHRLNTHVYDIAPQNANYKAAVSAVIDYANMGGWLDQLILKAREANPGNPKLLEFTREFGLTSIDAKQPAQDLQRAIKKENPLLDVNVWLKQAGEIEARTCRIEFETEQGRVINGTGFLFGGPDVVMTNYHVMEAVIKKAKGEKAANGSTALPEKVECRFDFKRTDNGAVLNQGVVYKLADAPDWLIDYSEGFPLDQDPPDDRLDYALIRLAEAAGEDTVGDKGSEAGANRGYIPFPASPFDPQPGSGLCIMQHPKGAPLKLAIDSSGVLGVNASKNRLRYETNTETGSSGSACFTMKWELVALHHSGDPDFDLAHKPTYNEGITMTAITKLVKQRSIDKQIVKQ